MVGNGADQRDGGRAAISEATVQDARAWDRCATDAAGLLHLARSRIRVRLKIIRNELIKNVGKFQLCMVSKLRIIFERIVLGSSRIVVLGFPRRAKHSHATVLVLVVEIRLYYANTPVQVVYATYLPLTCLEILPCIADIGRSIGRSYYM